MSAARVDGIPTKMPLDELFASEVNSIVNAVNEHAGELDGLRQEVQRQAAVLAAQPSSTYVPIEADHWGPGDPPQALTTVNSAIEYLHGRGGASTAPANVTPAKPNWSYVSASRALSLAHALGTSELEYSTDGGLTWKQYTGTITVDSAQHTAGDYLGRVKAASGRNVSSVALSPAIAAAPASTPTIASFSPASGVAGSTFVITGTGFTGATLVSINSGSVAGFTVDSATQITATLTSAQATGLVRVTTPAGTATSASNFTVTAATTGKIQIVDAGDSITESGGASQPYPAWLQLAYGNNFTVSNQGHGGQTANGYLSEVATRVDARYDATAFAYNIFTLQIGINDFGTRTNAQIKADIETLHRDRVAKGFICVAGTILPRQNVQSRIDDVNAHIRANYLSWGCKELNDSYTEPALLDTTNPAIYNKDDQLHPTDFGQQYLARCWKRTLDRLFATLGIATNNYKFRIDGGVPSSFSSLASQRVAWTALSNATAPTNQLVLTSGGTAHSTKGSQALDAPVRAFFEAGINANGGHGYIGFSAKASATSTSSDIAYGIEVFNGQARAIGNLVLGGEAFVAVASGDVLRVQVELGQMSLYQNGNLLKTWLGDIDVRNLQLDTAADSNISFNNVRIAAAALLDVEAAATDFSPETGEAVVWTNLSSATANGNTINLLNGGATANSTKAIGSSTAPVRGFVEFGVGTTGSDIILALSPNAAASSGYDDFGIGLHYNGAGVRPFGNLVGGASSGFTPVNPATDRIRIQLQGNGTAVGYYLNGTRFALAQVTVPLDDLAIDTATLGGSSFTNVMIYAAYLVTV